MFGDEVYLPGAIGRSDGSEADRNHVLKFSDSKNWKHDETIQLSHDVSRSESPDILKCESLKSLKTRDLKNSASSWEFEEHDLSSGQRWLGTISWWSGHGAHKGLETNETRIGWKERTKERKKEKERKQLKRSTSVRGRKFEVKSSATEW